MTFFASEHVEKFRVVHPLVGVMGDEQNGAFMVKPKGLKILISSGEGWEHVSVSRKSRTPSYEDMCWVKANFWGDEDAVMQLHVPKLDHVNCHEHCLHLWRPTDKEIPRPPSIFVGPRNYGS